jgi:outer membrane protein OmpA-like peptidoglycan-associated protein
MTIRDCRRRQRALPLLLQSLLLGGVLLTGRPPAAQEVTDSQSIIERLRNKPVTRGMEVEGTKSRDLGIAAQRIDLDIPFLNNSDALGRGALRQLTELGTALNSQELREARFLIAGHTSSTGKPEHNQKLSEARATVVKSYLVEHFGIPDSRLQAQGMGATSPRPNLPPAADQQRRVEIRVIAQQAPGH